LPAVRIKNYQVELITVTGVEMKKIRVKAGLFIWNRNVKEGTISADAVFDPACVNVSDIVDEGMYYGGFVLTLSTAPNFCLKGLKAGYTDASHCEGKGPQSFGTFGEVGTYDSNLHLHSVVLMHSAGNEDGGFWDTAFGAARLVPGFDRLGRVVHSDMEKGLASSLSSTMGFAKGYYDKRHLEKNMLRGLGAERATASGLYNRATMAPSPGMLEAARAQFGPQLARYLGGYPDFMLYRCLSAFEAPAQRAASSSSSLRTASWMGSPIITEPRGVVSIPPRNW
jgi:hypothetical protein